MLAKLIARLIVPQTNKVIERKHVVFHQGGGLGKLVTTDKMRVTETLNGVVVKSFLSNPTVKEQRAINEKRANTVVLK